MGQINRYLRRVIRWVVVRCLGQRLRPLRLLCSMIFASLLLSGCVHYDVGVHFDHPNHGEIVQHIKLGERLWSFSGESATEWLNSIERRAQELQGKTRRSNQEITVTIPSTMGLNWKRSSTNFLTQMGRKIQRVLPVQQLNCLLSTLSLV